MKKVLVINNHDSFVYNLIGLLKEIEEVEYKIMQNDQIDFGQLKNYQYILLSPGPGIPQEANQLMQVIDHTQKTHSILGVCLGHQAINEYFGGTLKQIPLPKHGHLSTLQITNNKDILFQGIGSPIQVGRYHSWTIDQLGDSLEISSIDEEDNIMSIFHIEYPIHSVQFHPESIISNCGKAIIKNWLFPNKVSITSKQPFDELKTKTQRQRNAISLS